MPLTYKSGELVTAEASAQRAEEMFALANSGHSLRSIGRQYGISHVRVMAILKDFEQENPEYPVLTEGRRREVTEQIRAGIRGLWPKYEKGDAQAVQAMVKLMKLYCSVHGVETPVQQSSGTQVYESIINQIAVYSPQQLQPMENPTTLIARAIEYDRRS